MTVNSPTSLIKRNFTEISSLLQVTKPGLGLWEQGYVYQWGASVITEYTVHWHS